MEQVCSKAKSNYWSSRPLFLKGLLKSALIPEKQDFTHATLSPVLFILLPLQSDFCFPSSPKGGFPVPVSLGMCTDLEDEWL